MIEQLLDKRNLNRAYEQVCANKGAGGVDGMQISELKAHLQTRGKQIISEIRDGNYQPKPIKGVEIPKSNGTVRLLGMPTVTDRIFQQALHQVLEPLFEPNSNPMYVGLVIVYLGLTCLIGNWWNFILFPILFLLVQKLP